MCSTCWSQNGSPKIVNYKVLEVVGLIKKIYEYSSTGGNLHIVLDDWNIDLKSIDWCLKNALKLNIHEAGLEELELERKCATLLRSMPLKERASALALNDGFFKSEPPLASPKDQEREQSL